MADNARALGTLYWAKVDYKNPDKGAPQNPGDNLQVCFVPDDMEAITGLASDDDHPVLVSDATDTIPDQWVRMKTSYVDRPLKVVDAKNNPLPHDLALGNGTRAYVYFTGYEYDYGKNSRGTKLNLNGLQVIEHVPYEAAEFEEVEGFVFNGEEVA